LLSNKLPVYEKIPLNWQYVDFQRNTNHLNKVELGALDGMLGGLGVVEQFSTLLMLVIEMRVRLSLLFFRGFRHESHYCSYCNQKEDKGAKV
jgi:hypothetical protein